MKRKHRATRGRELDPLSSAVWLEAWDDLDVIARVVAARAGPPPVVAPRTWFARRGWQRLGRLRLDEAPRSPA